MDCTAAAAPFPLAALFRTRPATMVCRSQLVYAGSSVEYQFEGGADLCRVLSERRHMCHRLSASRLCRNLAVELKDA